MDRIFAPSIGAPQPHPERVEISSSAPTPESGAPSLGAHIDRVPPRIDFPIEAFRAFGEDGQ